MAKPILDLDLQARRGEDAVDQVLDSAIRQVGSSLVPAMRRSTSRLVTG
jgi:hypothetical protein